MIAKQLNQKTLFAFVLTACGLVTSLATAQIAPQQPPLVQPVIKLPASSSEVNKPASLIITAGPAWQELTQAQRLSLTPLLAHWNTLDAAIKRKWIAIAANYPTLSPAEQVKLHSRMSEWSLLSKQEQAYQALDTEEKKKLAASAPPKPLGAAGAAKPVAPQKLVIVPLSGKNQTQKATIITPSQKVLDNNTILPLPTQAIEPILKAE